jgi:hypothetical protein
MENCEAISYASFLLFVTCEMLESFGAADVLEACLRFFEVFDFFEFCDSDFSFLTLSPMKPAQFLLPQRHFVFPSSDDC